MTGSDRRNPSRYVSGSHMLFSMTLALGVALSTAASAQTSFITPFPDGGTYRVFVFGDSLGNGLQEGLRHALRLEPDIRVENKSVANSRLSRTRPINWPDHMAEIVKKTTFDIAVMTFGVNDRGTISINGRRYAVGTPEWNNAYGKRIGEVVRAAKAKGAAVYWVGLPPMRGPRTSNDAQVVNAIAREHVYRMGGKFVDTWDGFTDGNGNFSLYGPDLTGKIRRLRSKDGVYFTGRGYRKLAHFVERIIRRDIALARAERDVPLAGGPQEQAIVKRLAGQSNTTKKLAARGNSRNNTAKSNSQVVQSGDHKAAHATVRFKVPGKNGGRSKTLQIRILRPALPAAVVSHIQRRSNATSANQLGRNLPLFREDGIGMLNSVASGKTEFGGSLASRVSVTQSPYYKALIKGDALPSKPGRADDFSWPPQNREPLPAAGS